MTQQQAQIEWINKQPYASAYGDIYFSSDSGLAETDYVFLQHNQLAQRWQTLTSQVFTIAETGFGTGLNFLCAWNLWKRCAPTSAHLHFISTEKHPLSKDDLGKVLSLWPELADLSQQLLASYEHLTLGWHRLVFDGGRVTLTLLIGDANQTLPQLKASVDAWFLDGFAPAKNPEMWQPALFQQMARLSHAATTFATFTSAGDVKRGLQAVGFEVSKAAGFGKKREMLYGHFTSQHSAAGRYTAKKAIVIGGGLAGTASAEALARRGWQVSLIERHAALASEGSGNPLGVLYPRLTGGETPLNSLALQGFLYTLRLLKRLLLKPDDYSQCGVLQLAFNAREQQRLNKIIKEYHELIQEVDSETASELSGIKLNKNGVFIQQAGWLNPASLCQALSQHSNIKLQASTQALKLIKQGQNWQVWGDERLIDEAPVLVIASANDTQTFSQSAHCELSSVRGQITLLPATEASAALKTVICTDGYLSPARQGQHCLGATFSPKDTATDIRDEDHASNLKMLTELAPEWANTYQLQQLQGRAAIRCSTNDYLPLAGAVLDAEELKQNPPRYNTCADRLPWLDGLYVNAGHGAKGLVNAPLCAEAIASLICGEPSPISSSLLSALDPNRFLLKSMGLKQLAQTIQSQIKKSAS
jgi:tRNA 5-methylaminomethyl-2-thiouridine biosynthesis bifunctional protein